MSEIDYGFHILTACYGIVMRLIVPDMPWFFCAMFGMAITLVLVALTEWLKKDKAHD